MNTNAIVNVRTFTSCLLPTRSFIRITSPFSSIIPDCFAAPSKVPIESNIFTNEKLITSIITVNRLSNSVPIFCCPEKNSFYRPSLQTDTLAIKNHFDIDGKRRFLELQQYSVLVLRQQKRAAYKTSGYVVNSYGSR
mgnify:CR=1 FL=1